MKTMEITNPILGDSIKFLVSEEDTNGQYEEVEVTMPPGCRFPIHYHLIHSEDVLMLSGEMIAECDGITKNLGVGDRTVNPAGSSHSAYNPGHIPCVFQVRIIPACKFEKMMRISYGLVNDGKTTKKGIPRNLLELAVVFKHIDTYPVGVPRWMLTPIFNLLYRIARWRGVEEQLERQYCR